MEIFIIICILIFFVILLGIIYKFSMKQIKKMAENKEIDEIVLKLPSNVEVCKSILKKVNNENVEIEEKETSDASLYIAIQNKIIIANTRNNYTRIQTIAHECLHSIQDRSMLIFNFIYSNIYLLIFATFVILGIFKAIPDKMLFLTIFIILSFIYYFIRSFLEDDAMTKAPFLAKEYVKDTKLVTDNEIEKLMNQYNKLNNLMIKSTNYMLFNNVIVKTILLGIIFIIF